MIIIIPFVLIAFLVLGIIGVGSKLLKVKVTPYFAIVFLIMAIIHTVSAVKSSHNDKTTEKKINIILAVIYVILFVIFACSSCTAGDILDTAWHLL